MDSPSSSSLGPATLVGLVEELAEDADLASQLIHRAYLPAHPSRFGELDPPLPEKLDIALRSLGISRLWSHQIDGLQSARACKDTLVLTPTASGKSLVFQLPVLEEALSGGDGRALFLFPLKALGQDQKGKLNRLAKLAGLDPEVDGAAIYDGDTPRKKREQIRANPPRVVISNPDMAHFGMLGHAASWVPLFSSLKWIVLDELHTYRGIFGCHFYHVLQRLLRLARRHGSHPTIIASSATATNAPDFAKQLTARTFEVVDKSGAPREGRHFLLYQPSTSPYTTALSLLIRCLEGGLKTIVFTKARRITELLHSWLANKEPEMAARVANYRAGFLPEERRQIESDLFNGRLDGVISTSALEMGIDVGGLDACILVGFPGSMMATWQRSGRVGREGRESITALVAMPDALDQYLLRNPEEFLGRSCEPLVVSPENEVIGERHLLCAAAELPLERGADASYLERHRPLVIDLLQRFELAESEGGQEIHSLKKAPHRGVSLRGSGSTYTIESDATGRPIGTVDGIRVLRECHPGAIYLHAGRQFSIVELDTERRRALATPARVDYFTAPLTEKDTRILEVLDHRHDGPLQAWLGRVRVTERVVGFERKRILSQEKLGHEELELPPVEFETLALWWTAPRAIEETLREHSEDFMGALHAAEHAAISLFPVLALCDRGDLGGISIPHHPQVGCGAVFVYDGHPGGAGIATSGFRRLPELLDKVTELLDQCACEDGCPGCIQSPKCGNGNRPLDKAGAARLLRLLLGREVPNQPFEAAPPPDLDAWPEDEGRSEAAAGAAAASENERSPGRAKARAPARRSKEPAGYTLPTRGRFRLPERGSASQHTATARSGESRDLFDLGDPASFAGGARLRSPEMRARAHRRAPIPATVERTVLFDVETKRAAKEVGGWDRLYRLGVALAVSCDLEENVFRAYRENEVEELVRELHSADMVIGFNVIRFDYPVLSGYTGEDFRRTLPTLDLFEQIEHTAGKKIGLSRLATETLGAAKTGDGLQSLEWYREGRFDLIEDYCRVDVELLRDLYLFGRREGHVCYRNKQDLVVRIPVDWP